MSYEAPQLEGKFEPNNHLAPISGPSGSITQKGEWRPEELLVATHSLGEVAIFGNCLADAETQRGYAARALEEDRPEILSQLPGSYSVIVVQPNQERLTVLTDLAGLFPVFYRTDNSEVHFASQLGALRKPTDRPDTATLAAQTAAPWSADLIAGRSAVEGIRRLDPGHVVTIGRDGVPNVSEYETFSSPSTTLGEAAEALREALLDSTQLRTNWGRRMSSDFSGGLDSTSLAYLTAQTLDYPLLVTTRHAPDTPVDDLNYVRQYLKLPASRGLFNAKEFEHPPESIIYSNLLGVPVGDEPDISIVSRALDVAYLRFLKECGSELHLSGNGADGILDMDPRQYLAALARPHTFPKFLKSIVEVARIERTSPFEVLTGINSAAKMNPRANLQAISRFLGTSESGVQQRNSGLILGAAVTPRWLTPKARQQLSDLAASRADEVPRNNGSLDLGNYHAYSEIKSLGAAQRGSMQLAANLGIREHVPYMDNDVLRACFGIPSHIRVNPWTFKAILGKALEDLVPNIITQRSTKGDYTRHAFQGLRASMPELNELLRDSRLADLGVVDPSRIKASLERANMGANPPWVSLDGFIAAELWLRKWDYQPDKTDAKPAPQHPQINIAGRNSEVDPPLVTSEMQYGMADGVIMATRPHGAIILDVNNGNYHRLNLEAMHVVQALSATSTFGEAIDELAKIYANVERAQLRLGASSVIHKLLQENILINEPAHFSIVDGSGESTAAMPAMMTRQTEGHIKVRARDYIPAVGGLAIALALQRLPFDRQINVLAKIRKHWGKNTSTPLKAERILTAIHDISKLYLGRMACLELSLATVLAAALTRQKVDLVLGTRTDPDSFHAWPEVDGVPIRTAVDEPIEGVFQSILKV